jgi:tRNA(Ile)-lysidine synthetase-like protein
MVKEVIHTLPWSNADMHIDICSRAEVSFVSDSTRQYVDGSNITLPFVIRVWQPGDEFHPLGAPGRQKVSDYLTHAKAPAWKKKKTCVLESHNTIVSVLGMRICENFKIHPHSEECIRIQFFTERNLSAE